MQDLKKGKAGKLNTGMVSALILLIIVLIVIYTILAETAPDMGAVADNLTEEENSSGACVSGGNCAASVLPLTSFFKKKGIIFLALMAGIVIVMITALLKFKKS